MNKVVVLNVEYTFGNITNTIHPVILMDEEEMILVDCGYPGFLSKIKASAQAENIDLDKITKIIITHHDYDHMGALADFKDEYPNVQVLASEEQIPYISGEKKSLRLQQAEAIYDSLPDSQKEGARKIQQLFSSVKPAKVDEALHDNDRLCWCGGVEIIDTSGHMPGHISLYIKELKALIAGDALAIRDGKLGISNPEYTLDMETAIKSVNKLLDYDIERVICYHGGVYESELRKALMLIVCRD